MNFILTSCGLSILTNYLREEHKIQPKEIYKYSNSNENEIDVDFLTTIKKAVNEIKENIASFSENELKKLSAELNTLVTFYNNQFNAQDFHLLLYTDTYLGSLTADILEHFLNSKGLQVNKFLAKDLNTNSTEEFELSLSEIIKELSNTIEGYRDSNYEIIFNLTGGFKGSNSFLQTMASLYADKSIYIFETGKELLVIPRLPIKIDEDFFAENINIFRDFELEININRSSFNKLPKSIINKIGDEFTISPWGEMAWQKYKNQFYRTKLIEPISDKIVYSNEFKKDFEKLSKNEKWQLNKSIDKLEQYIYKNENLRSLRFHNLKNEKYSHEFYPFDGNDSRRAYCNKKNNGEITLEKIDAHLK